MSKYRKIDIGKAKTIKSESRKTKAAVQDFGKPFDGSGSLSGFLETLPKSLKAKDFLEVSERIARAKANGKKIVWMMGAHPIKIGLSPVVIDLAVNGFISHLAVNGAFLIHDMEVAFFGRTSEEVAEGLEDGSFGMVEETPRLVFESAKAAVTGSLGLGEGAGKFIMESKPEFCEYSIIARCYNNDIPVTVHVAVGTDTVSQHPGYDGGMMGKLSGDDFLIFAESVAGLSDGIVLNFGSAVILPEVFLKALTAARNIKGEVKDFAAANFDMIQHYRPIVNVVSRPTAGSGRGFAITGHHEIMMPLLAAAVKIKYKEIVERK